MVFEVGLLAGGATMFIRYLIGFGNDGFNPSDIFADYTVHLAENRLKRMGAFNEIYRDFMLSKANCRNKAEIAQVVSDYKIIVVNNASPLFTWERPIGMCAICTGFWVAVLVWIAYTIFFSLPQPVEKHFLEFFQILITSHIFLRLTTKFL